MDTQRYRFSTQSEIEKRFLNLNKKRLTLYDQIFFTFILIYYIVQVHIGENS